MNKKRVGLSIVIGMALLVVGVLAYAYLAFPSKYVNRVLRWGDADVYDYQKFPERDVASAAQPFMFEVALAEDKVREAFQVGGGFDDLDAFLSKNGTQAFLVIQHDTILYESYYNDAARDSIVTSFSTAKSFAATLIGIAIAEGDIDSVHDPITAYLPELLETDARFAEITIEDLLRMSSGIRYVEFPFVNGDDAKTYYYPDLRMLALTDTEIAGESGEIFHYNNYHPLLLGMILERTTGMSVAANLQDRLWTQIGSEYAAGWSLDEEGFEKMESGINARAIDFAKFGRLYLQDGMWAGQQVVPADWVKASTAPYLPTDYAGYYGDEFIFSDGQGYYGYMWWGIQTDSGGYDFVALGNHGQFIYLSPEANLIIVRFGERYGEYGGAEGWVEMFYAAARTIAE